MYRRIRDLREDSDLLQRDLAEYLQCSQVCYSHYEMGKRDIPTDVLIKLADCYHTSIDYLLGRTDEKHPSVSASFLPAVRADAFGRAAASNGLSSSLIFSAAAVP